MTNPQGNTPPNDGRAAAQGGHGLHTPHQTPSPNSPTEWFDALEEQPTNATRPEPVPSTIQERPPNIRLDDQYGGQMSSYRYDLDDQYVGQIRYFGDDQRAERAAISQEARAWQEAHPDSRLPERLQYSTVPQSRQQPEEQRHRHHPYQRVQNTRQAGHHQAPEPGAGLSVSDLRMAERERRATAAEQRAIERRAAEQRAAEQRAAARRAAARDAQNHDNEGLGR